jgi:hypothetical protein
MRGKFPVSFQITKRGKYEPADVKVIYADAEPAPGTDPAGTPSLPPGSDGALTGKAEAGGPSLARQEFSPPPAYVPLNPQAPPDFERHARRCCICSHPDRDAIEGEFVRWASPRRLAKDYHIADRVSLYRHAHATGLFPRRKREFARVLEDILECVEHSSLEESADVIIRAARVYAHLDENGNWFEPPRTHIILTGPAPSQFTENPDLTPTLEPQPNKEHQEISLNPVKKRTYTCKSKQKLTAMTIRKSKAKKRLIAMTIRRGSASRATNGSRGTPDKSHSNVTERPTNDRKAKKRLIATHPNSKNGPTQ